MGLFSYVNLFYSSLLPLLVWLMFWRTYFGAKWSSEYQSFLKADRAFRIKDMALLKAIRELMWADRAVLIGRLGFFLIGGRAFLKDDRALLIEIGTLLTEDRVL